METDKFEAEWCVLQNQFDSYEKHSLYIKLISILVLLIAEVLSALNLYIVLVLAVLWIQDAIWKTFQSRIEPRLLQIEKYIFEQSKESAFQFNSEYQKKQVRGDTKVFEYTFQAIRPTVAFPHIVLILIIFAKYIFWS